MKLEGVIAACVTPWRHGDQVDQPALWRHLEMLLAAGVNGVCMAGSTGEFPRLDPDNYDRLIRAAVEFTAGRVPVLACCGAASLDGSVDLARLAAQAGASAVVVPPPIYFPYGQREIIAFYERFTAAATLPVFLYNIPQFTSVVEPATAASLLKRGLFVGLKDSGGTPEMLDALLALRKDHAFSFLWGNDSSLLAALNRGVDGALSGIAACAPELLVALYCTRDPKLQSRLDEFIGRIGAFPTPIGVRIALEARGIAVGPHAVPVPADQAREFALWFERWLGA
jgi:4-hydroxy-tetrahydrodipicolinate synthase